MSTIVNEALRLAEHGYPVFPCRPKDKKPLTDSGFKDATTNEEQIAAWWTQWPTANIGVCTNGLVVVDIDPLPDGGRNPFLDTVQVQQARVYAAVSTTPRGGTHLWYAQKPGVAVTCSQSRVAPNVDVRADGGYVVVPPSYVDTEKSRGWYRWEGDELCARKDLAFVPGWIVEAASTPIAAETAWRDNPDAKIPDNYRTKAMMSQAGSLRRTGLSEMEIRAALRAINNERCDPPLPVEKIDGMAKSAAQYDENEIAAAIANGTLSSLFDFIDLDIDIEPSEPEPPIALPDELMNPGGLLGEIIDYNLRTAHKRQPELALASALALMATLTGRKIQDERKTRTNLYVVGLADTGTGKEHARQLNKDILEYADPRGTLLAPEGVGSAQGIVSHLAERPCLLFQLDEFGKVLEAIGSAIRSPHLQAIPATLMRLYSSANSTYISDAVVDTKRTKSIKYPHCVVYATTVPASFLAALTPTTLRDGFVNRLIVVESSQGDPRPQTPSGEPIPQSILDQAKWWVDHQPCGDLSDATGVPRRLTASPEAVEVFAALDEQVRERMHVEGSIRELWVRVAEQARKLALLFRVSRVADAETIDESSARLGASLALSRVARIAWLAKRHVSESPIEDACKRVLRIIAAAGADGLPSSQLTRKTQWLRNRDRQDTIQTLAHSGQITIEARQTGKRPATVYVST